MNPHGVEISIARGVRKMVGNPNHLHAFVIIFIMSSLFLGTRSFVQRSL